MNPKDYLTIGACEISHSAIIHHGSIIGKKYRRYLNGSFEGDSKTIILDNVYIGYSCLIGNGSKIGKNSILDDKSVLESSVVIGENNLVIYGAQICCDVTIKNNCVIGGFIGERTTIGNHCRIFGSIIHSQHQPLDNWDSDDSMEESPVIHDKVFIGFKSIISAPVKIGPRAYICAGSIVTKDVPEQHIAHGVNQIIHYSKWNGPLKNSNLFK